MMVTFSLVFSLMLIYNVMYNKIYNIIFFKVLYFYIILLFFILLLLYLFFYEFFIFNNIYYNISLNVSLILLDINFLNIKISKESLILSLLVLNIFFFSFIYSYYYLIYEEDKEKFFIFLPLFTFGMIIIFLSNNMLLSFLFWEVIGLSSFWLIGHYNKKISTFKSALKAMFFNKFSDIIFLISLILYFVIYKTFTYQNFNYNKNNYSINFFFVKLNLNALFLILITLFCTIKSAQFIFSIWLIDSMDAPVPASALIHSATLVIAGIYILYNFKYLFLNFPKTTLFISLSCLISSLIYSFVACFQSDFKRILAYSTISQCGFLIVITLISTSDKFIFYAVMHGIIKSSLFLICGTIFLINKHVQDIRNINNLYNMSTHYLYFLLLTLSALPLSFFYDFKHSIFFNLNYAYFNLYKVIFNSIFILLTLCSFFYSFNIINKIYFVRNVTNRGFNSTYRNFRNNVECLSYINFIIIPLIFFILLLISYNFFYNNNTMYIFTIYEYKNYILLKILVIIILIFIEYIYNINFKQNNLLFFYIY